MCNLDFFVAGIDSLISACALSLASHPFGYQRLGLLHISEVVLVRLFLVIVASDGTYQYHWPAQC